MKLTVDQYNDYERKVQKDLPNRAIQGFRPATFLQENYPDRVLEDVELIRYVDVMQGPKAKTYVAENVTYSEDESRLIRKICESVGELTLHTFGKKILPWISPLAAVRMFRIITAFSSFAECLGLKRGDLSIFEIGPGSGYLGAQLISAGYRYASMDNTQAFYLWQNRLYDHLAKEEFTELAFDSNAMDQNRVMHIPWWKYCTLYENNTVTADIVCCDHVLGEVGKRALKYIVRASKQMLSSSKVPLFIFGSPGKLQISNLDDIHAAFLEAGFVLVNYYKGFFAYTPKGSALAMYEVGSKTLPHTLFQRVVKKLREKIKHEYLLYKSIEKEIELYNPSNSSNRYSAQEFMDFSLETSPYDYKFLSFLGQGIPQRREKN
ncbi:hypothetical protein ACFL38_00595 [Candidatus Omnitrophota bacterium]